MAPKSRDAAAGVRLLPAIVRRIEADETIVDLIREIFRRWFEMVQEDPRELRRHHLESVAFPGGFESGYHRVKLSTDLALEPAW